MHPRKPFARDDDTSLPGELFNDVGHSGDLIKGMLGLEHKWAWVSRSGKFSEVRGMGLPICGLESA